MLGKEHFLRILGDDVTVFRYVDDTITFIPKERDTGDLLKRLSEVEPKIQFTYEEEQDGKLPFLDMIIWKSEHELKLTVYRKPTN